MPLGVRGCRPGFLQSWSPQVQRSFFVPCSGTIGSPALAYRKAIARRVEVLFCRLRFAAGHRLSEQRLGSALA
jgi:hypothetical protein